MKINYSQRYCIAVLMLFAQIGFSQNPLKSSSNIGKIQKYLEQKSFNFSEVALNDLYIDSEYIDQKTNVTHIYIGQQFQGIKIFNAISSMAVRDDKVLYIGNSFVKNSTKKVNTAAPSISAQQAIQYAATYFKLGNSTSLKSEKSEKNEFEFTATEISRKNIPVNLVYAVTEDDRLVLSWDMIIHTMDGKHIWSARIDATTGEIVDFNDNLITCNFGTPEHSNNTLSKPKVTKKEPAFSLFKSNTATSIMTDGSAYNVFALPLESPTHGARQTVNEPANLNASPYGWHDTNGVAGAEFTITRGNNVYAYDDQAASNTPGVSPDAGASLSFDYPLDFGQVPNEPNNLNSSITNLFYINNMMHDIWYEYGFDEAAGNFQQTNYGGVGLGNDYVLAEALDGESLNNANFNTPADGSNPTMQMFLWTGNATLPTFDINSPAGIAGSYTTAPASFGSSEYNVTGDLVLVDDGSANPIEGCEALTNGSAIAGNIAVIDRGSCEFGIKALNAENAGAIAVIVINNVAGSPTNMGPGVNGGSVTIPAVMISLADGDLIKAQIASGVNVTMTDTADSQIDGSFDNGIIAHEYGHGISTRLTGGPATSCLRNEEQMGEGWSDWFGLMVTLEPGDLGTDSRGIGTYAQGQPTTGGGIRPYPYSTDTNIDPQTYDDIKVESVPHGVGSVWCSMLWDLTWAYVDAYGFDADLYTGTGGNNKVMHLVLQGLKLQGCSPGFIDGRDALLAADEILTGGENKCMIWQVFAARGLGASADQGNSGSRSDGIEAFDVPDAYAQGIVTAGDACGSDTFEFNFSNLSTSEITQVDYTYTIDGGTPVNDMWTGSIASCASTTIPVTIGGLSRGTHILSFSTTTPSTLAKSYVINGNDTGVENQINTFETATDALVSYDLGGNIGTWERGTAAGTSLSDAVAQNSQVYGTNLDGIHGDASKFFLVSQCYDLSDLEDTFIKFDMAFDIEIDFDVLYIEYSTDGGTIWNVLGTSTDPDWYNSDVSSCANCIGKQWTGEAANATTHSDGGINGEMHTYSYSLSDFDSTGSAESNIVFRFNYHADAGFAVEGAIVDNFIIEGVTNVLSVDENEFKNLSIAPVPTKGLLILQSSTSIKDAQILVYDMMGRRLFKGININTISDNEANIDLSSAASGTYFISVENKTNKSVRRIIKK